MRESHEQAWQEKTTLKDSSAIGQYSKGSESRGNLQTACYFLKWRIFLFNDVVISWTKSPIVYALQQETKLLINIGDSHTALGCPSVPASGENYASRLKTW